MRTRLYLALVAAVALQASIAANGFASQIRLNNTWFRAIWQPLTIYGGGEVVIRCNLTLEGSFHRTTLTKTRGALVGHVRTASLNSCSGGTATLLSATLPWHIRYASFGGTLPNITNISLTMLGWDLQIDPTGVFFPACLVRAREEAPFGATAAREASGAISSLSANESPLVFEEVATCIWTGSIGFSGTATYREAAGPEPALLSSSSGSIVVERLEQNDSFTIRNTGLLTATVTRVDTTVTTPESPEFEVSSPGCRSTLASGETCTYVVAVRRRPERAGRVTIYYRDGAGGERTLSVGVTINS